MDLSLPPLNHMNNYPQLPKGHTSILSPAFKYVPAASTDVAQTFARIRAGNIQPQPAPSDETARQRFTNYGPGPGIEVLEAAWLS